jgi:nicotinate-nucleotide adenylyltransferase
MNHCKGKIGIYGGTFDPIHFGHLNLAIEIQEAHQLAEVWFCPAQISPHKLNAQPIAATHRLEMLKLAIEGIPNFYVNDIELKRQGPSFTLDTLRALIAQEATSSDPRQFCLMIGDDSIPGFFKWHKPEEIVKLVPILVGRRQSEFPELKGDSAICAALRLGITPTRIMDIGATRIRSRLTAGLYCGHLIPAKVVDYIYVHHLYSLK